MPSDQSQPSDEEKAKKAAEKAKRKAEFEAKRAAELAAKKNQSAKNETGQSSKSKAELRKERRDQQEAQRAEKTALKETQQPKSTKKTDSSKEKGIQEKIEYPPVSKQSNDRKPKEKVKKLADVQPVKSNVSSTSCYPHDTVEVFPQIPKRAIDVNELTRNLGVSGEVIHPSIIRLGLQLNKGVIKGSTPRSLGLMVALKEMVSDYETPSGKVIDRDLPSKIDESMKFLAQCRPLSTGMINGSIVVRKAVQKLSRSCSSDEEIVSNLLKLVDNYIGDEIVCALKSTIIEADELIYNGETILTYGWSLKMKHVFHQAIKSGKTFNVIVVDSGPQHEAIEMVQFLKSVSHEDQIRIRYIYVSALSHVMKTVSKVMIGGHGIFANGYVMAQMGCSQVALVAKSFNIPFIVLCETNEFADSVHTDAFVYNESGLCEDYLTEKNEKLQKFFYDVDNLSEKDLEKRKYLKILNLLFDVTPPEYVSAIVTERGVLPCSAVSAVIRRNYTRLQ